MKTDRCAPYNTIRDECTQEGGTGGSASPEGRGGCCSAGEWRTHARAWCRLVISRTVLRWSLLDARSRAPQPPSQQGTPHRSGVQRRVIAQQAHSSKQAGLRGSPCSTHTRWPPVSRRRVARLLHTRSHQEQEGRWAQHSVSSREQQTRANGAQRRSLENRGAGEKAGAGRARAACKVVYTTCDARGAGVQAPGGCGGGRAAGRQRPQAPAA